MSVMGHERKDVDDDVWSLPKKLKRRNISKDGTMSDEVVTGHDAAVWAEENGVKRKYSKAEENLFTAMKYLGAIFVVLVSSLS